MVTWYVKEATSECIIYEYFPEDKKDKKPGLITIDRINEKIELKIPAELDFNRTVSEEDARRLCEVIFDNTDEVETEIATVTGSSYWFYYNHADRKICEDYNAGMVRHGMVAWF